MTTSAASIRLDPEPGEAFSAPALIILPLSRAAKAMGNLLNIGVSSFRHYCPNHGRHHCPDPRRAPSIVSVHAVPSQARHFPTLFEWSLAPPRLPSPSGVPPLELCSLFPGL